MPRVSPRMPDVPARSHERSAAEFGLLSAFPPSRSVPYHALGAKQTARCAPAAGALAQRGNLRHRNGPSAARALRPRSGRGAHLEPDGPRSFARRRRHVKLHSFRKRGRKSTRSRQWREPEVVLVYEPRRPVCVGRDSTVRSTQDGSHLNRRGLDSTGTLPAVAEADPRLPSPFVRLRSERNKLHRPATIPPLLLEARETRRNGRHGADRR